jgi:uncharacterized protein YdhG (YjbR/CyaY superfamily)
MAPGTFEEYLSSLPPASRAVLVDLRQTLLSALPDGEDAISYGMPTVTVAGRRVVHYAVWKDHASLYPVPAADDDLHRDLAPYVAGKGTLHFPLDQPLPHELVARVATALLRERG